MTQFPEVDGGSASAIYLTQLQGTTLACALNDNEKTSHRHHGSPKFRPVSDGHNERGKNNENQNE